MYVWTIKKSSNGNAASADARVKRFGNSGRFETPNHCRSAQIMLTRVRSMSRWPTMRRSVLARCKCRCATIETAAANPRSVSHLSRLPTGAPVGRARALNTSRVCYSGTTISVWLSRSVNTDSGGYSSRQVRFSDLSERKLDTFSPTIRIAYESYGRIEENQGG
mgnify:CR=1 FL=1